mgnify:CR=1 FL=1
MSKIRVTKPIETGAFIAVARRVGAICRQNGGGIYIKAYKSKDGPDSEGKTDLKECDRVYVEAKDKKTADKVWKSLNSALEKENQIFTQEVDMGKVLQGSRKTKKEVLSQFIGTRGGNLKRITKTENAYTKITCPEGDGSTIKVECRREDALARMCDQVLKELNRIVWGNQYGKAKTPEKGEAKENTSSGSFALVRDELVDDSGDSTDDDEEEEEEVDERTALLRAWIEEGVVGAGYVVSDTVLALVKMGYTKEEIDGAQEKAWEAGEDPEDIGDLDRYLPKDMLARRNDEKAKEEEVKQNLEAKFRTKALGDAVMGAISGSTIEELNRDRREFNSKRQEIAERKGVDFWEVTPGEVEAELRPNSEEAPSRQEDDDEWEKTYAEWQSQQKGDKPKDVVSTDSSWSKPIDLSEKPSGASDEGSRNITLSVLPKDEAPPAPAVTFDCGKDQLQWGDRDD